jgi:hypothetical protein
MTGGLTDVDPMRTFVRSHHVQYHVWPEVWRCRRAITQVGYRLELAADAPTTPAHATPGSEASREVYDGLRDVARAILPAPDADARCEIEPFDNAWHGRLIPEVILNISVLHRGDGTVAADLAQRQCVAEMKKKLQALGAVEASGAGAGPRTVVNT